MKNVDKIAQFVAKTGGSNIIIHIIPGTQNWLVCEKEKTDKWSVIMCNPLRETWVIIKTITNEQHISLWGRIKKAEIKNKVTFIKENQKEELG